MTGVIHHYDKRDPSESMEKREEQTDGCPSCRWYGWSSSSRTRIRCCGFSQSAFPNGGKTICVKLYQPKTKQSKGRGHVDQKSR